MLSQTPPQSCTGFRADAKVAAPLPRDGGDVYRAAFLSSFQASRGRGQFSSRVTGEASRRSPAARWDLGNNRLCAQPRPRNQPGLPRGGISRLSATLSWGWGYDLRSRAAPAHCAQSSPGGTCRCQRKLAAVIANLRFTPGL